METKINVDEIHNVYIQPKLDNYGGTAGLFIVILIFAHIMGWFYIIFGKEKK